MDDPVTGRTVRTQCAAAGHPLPHPEGCLPARLSRLEPLDQLASVLEAHPNTLLVLDNFEQLVEEGALRVLDLLAKAASVKLLVTSRQQLHIEGERAFHLAPLPARP